MISLISIDRFHCHAIKKLIENHQVKKAPPNFRCSSKCFAEIYRAQFENAMLVHPRGTPIWRPENSVNIWNLLWLSRRLIISIEQTSIYVSTFPNALTFKKAQNHDISIYFSAISIVDLCHAPPTTNFKMLWFLSEARY